MRASGPDVRPLPARLDRPGGRQLDKPHAPKIPGRILDDGSAGRLPAARICWWRESGPSAIPEHCGPATAGDSGALIRGLRAHEDLPDPRTTKIHFDGPGEAQQALHQACALIAPRSGKGVIVILTTPFLRSRTRFQFMSKVVAIAQKVPSRTDCGPSWLSSVAAAARRAGCRLSL